MTNVSITVTVIVIVALLVVALIVVLGRGGRLKSFKLDVLKGMLGFGGTLDTKSPPGADILHEDEEYQDLAHKIIHWLREQKPQKVKGSYVLTESIHDNAQTAARLYSKVDGQIIGTCFFEGPFYGRGDFATTINQKAHFTRLTTSEVCDEATAKQIEDIFQTMVCKAKLVIIPKNVEVSKIGGIFCRLSDHSHLAFIALNNVQETSTNRGLVFSGTLAQELFGYFQGFVDKFGKR
jgi:hypothetical protein